MSETCTGCGQELPKNGPITVGEIEAAIKSQFREADSFWGGLQGKCPNLLIRNKEITPELVAYHQPESALFDYEGQQGVTYELLAVILINGELYRKTGSADSYGERSWDGPLQLVKASTKNIVVFE